MTRHSDRPRGTRWSSVPARASAEPWPSSSRAVASARSPPTSNPAGVKELASRGRAHRLLGGDGGGTPPTPTRATGLWTRPPLHLGSLDRVVSTVGWTAITRFLDETPEYWRRIVDVNLMSADLPFGLGRSGDERDSAVAASS